MGEWINDDGLRVRLGTTEAEVTRGGELPSSQEMRKWEFNITLSTATATSALIPDTTGILIPNGLFVNKVTIINETAATGATAVLNIGLVDQDTTTTFDADGLVAAIPLASIDVLGETVELVKGSTYAGALIGTVLTNTGYLVFDYDTAAFTAGEIRVLVEGYVPRPAASN